MHKLTDLRIWNTSIELSTDVYTATVSFPKEEILGLTSQIRRAAISISSNIAEGAGRNSQKEFVYFLNIANGSCYELKTQLTVARQLKFIDPVVSESLLQKIEDLQKMNYKLQSTIKEKMKPETV